MPLINSNIISLYEDNHLLALYKPAGMLIQGDRTGDETLLDIGKSYIKKKYNKPGAVYLHPVHRLDRPVSGVSVFARTSKALSRMNELFREHKITKTYIAIVNERMPANKGKLIDFIKKDTKTNTARIVAGKSNRSKDAKKAELEYREMARIAKNHLIKVLPKTGRPHQIRVQLSHVGCPIMGDVKYGSKKRNEYDIIFLHALSLEFVHPVKKEPMKISAAPPKLQDWLSFKDFYEELL
jgi:23S rRNA pseudouridine1911/1915/1917 synthase